MQVTENAHKIIVHYETGGRPQDFLTAYWDKYGEVWTIGIGSTRHLDGTPVKKGDQITLDQAYKLVDNHIEKEILPSLSKLVPKATQNQIDALASLIYNIGIGQFKDSTVYKFVLQNKPPDEITRAFAMWKKSGGQVLQGLILRRRSESELYNTGIVNLYRYDKKTDKTILI